MKEKNKKEIYVKPESEIINIEVEQPILEGSTTNYTDGGGWGF